MQLSHTGKGLSLVRIAAACGFAETEEANDIKSVRRIRKRLHETMVGPRFVVLKVKPENLPRSLRPRDAVYIKNRFRAALGFPTI